MIEYHTHAKDAQSLQMPVEPVYKNYGSSNVRLPDEMQLLKLLSLCTPPKSPALIKLEL